MKPDAECLFLAQSLTYYCTKYNSLTETFSDLNICPSLCQISEAEGDETVKRRERYSTEGFVGRV